VNLHFHDLAKSSFACPVLPGRYGLRGLKGDEILQDPTDTSPKLFPIAHFPQIMEIKGRDVPKS